MKILVVRFSSIGDIVLTTPVLRALNRAHPDGEIHYLTKKQYAGLLDGNQYVHRIWTLTENFKELSKQLKAEQFDMFIDLHNNLRTRRLGFALGIKTYRLNKLNFRKWCCWLISKWIACQTYISLIDTSMLPVRLELLPMKEVSTITCPDATALPADVILPSGIKLPGDYVCIAIGGQHETKKMPIEKLVALCKQIRKSVVLIGGKEDMEAGQAIASQVDWVQNLCGLLSIQQSAVVMRDSAWVVSHDTGMMHIAAALDKKIASVWGNTVPSFGMYPYRPDQKSQMFEVEGLSCRPCSKLGHEKCPKGHFKCMNLQNLQMIAKTVSDIPMDS